MATLEALMAAIGQPVESDAVQSLIAADQHTDAIDFDLGEGEPRRYGIAHRIGGYQLSHHRGRIDLAIVYARAGRGFEAFAGPLPGGLPPQATRREIQRQLGMPPRGGVGDQGPWDGYEVGPTSVVYCYDAEGELVLWTMIEPAATAPVA